MIKFQHVKMSLKLLMTWIGRVNAKTISVRINSIDTHYMYRDVVEVVEQAGGKLDTILLPKAGTASDIYMLSAMLNQIETAKGFSNRIGIEVLIETTLGMANVMDIALKKVVKKGLKRCTLVSLIMLRAVEQEQP